MLAATSCNYVVYLCYVYQSCLLRDVRCCNSLLCIGINTSATAVLDTSITTVEGILGSRIASLVEHIMIHSIAERHAVDMGIIARYLPSWLKVLQVLQLLQNA